MGNLGQYISTLRTKNNLSVRQLAALAHISHSEISRLEHGERKNPSIFVLKSIAEALGENLDNILKAAGYLDADISGHAVSHLCVNVDGLTEKEIEEVLDFIEFLKDKRRRLSGINVIDSSINT